MNIRVVIVVLICVSFQFLIVPQAVGEQPYGIEWVKQFGTTTGQTKSSSVAVDHLGNAIVTGEVFGQIGDTSYGYDDAHIAKYDSTGNLIWTKQIGSNNSDGSNSVDVDGFGNIYISGYTWGSIERTNPGGPDPFIAKYDPAGNHLWTTQPGTGSEEYSWSVAADVAGNAYIRTSKNSDFSLLTKFNPAGEVQWTRQHGEIHPMLSQDSEVAVDTQGNVYISGYYPKELFADAPYQFDAFVAKYDPSGNLLWEEKLGAGSLGKQLPLAVDHLDNVYLAGSSILSIEGNNAGSTDVFIVKYDSNGNRQWTEQFGATEADEAASVAIDHAGNAFICGYTRNDLEGNGSDGITYLAKINSNGDFLWADQIEYNEGYHNSHGVAVSPTGDVFITGSTYGSIAGPNIGGVDGYLIKYAVPEPACLALLSLAGLYLLASRKLENN